MTIRTETGIRRLGAGVVTGSRFAALGVSALIGFCTLGCGRRAPGPEDCHELALRMERNSPMQPEPPSGQILIPELSAEDEEDPVLRRTTECLTTPYDRALVSCVTSGSPTQSCWLAFVARHGSVRTMNRHPAQTAPDPSTY